MARTQELRAALFVVAAGMAFGFLVFLGRWALLLGVAPGEFLALRFASATLFTALGGGLVEGAQFFRISLRQLVRCLALGALGYALFSLLFIRALRELNAGLTVLIFFLYPAFVALGASFTERIPISRRQCLAMVTALTGMAALASPSLRALGLRGPKLIEVAPLAFPLDALASALGAAMLYAIYILACRRWLVSGSEARDAMYIQSGAAVALGGAVLISLFARDAPIRTMWGQGLAPALWAGAVSTSLAMALFLRGLRRLGSVRTSLLSVAEPLTGVLVSVALLHESLDPWQGMGALLVVAALLLASPRASA